MNRRTSIYLSTHAGNLPRGCTTPQVGLGHEPLKRFVPYYRDNRAVLSPTSTVLITYRVFKPSTNLFRDVRWHFQRGKDATNGEQFNKHIYSRYGNTTKAMKSGTYSMYSQSDEIMHVYRQESNTTDYNYYVQAQSLKQVYFTGDGATACIQK